MQSCERIIAGLVSEAGTLLRDASCYLARQFRSAIAYLWQHRLDVLLATCIGVAAAAFAVWRFYELDFPRLASIWRNFM